MNIPTSIIASGLALFLAAATGTAAAHGNSTGQSTTAATVSADPMQQIPHTLKALEEAQAGEYGKLRRDDKHRLDAAAREIEALMQGDRDLRTLDEQERTRLFNAQETIIAIVGDLKESQLVCTYRQNIGTRFRTKHCVTRGMAEAQRRASRDTVNAMQNASCFEGEGGGSLCGNP